MKNPSTPLLLLLLSLFGGLVDVKAQPLTESKGVLLDEVCAIVGSQYVLHSEIEQQYQQLQKQGIYGESNLRCRILDQLLFNKLLLHHADVDSVTVDEDRVEQKMDQNMQFYIQQIGSEEKLVEYYGKPIAELKEEFRPLVRDQMLVQEMQQTITKNVTASPADVKDFFKSIPSDSLPLLNAEIEYAQIVMDIPPGIEEVKRTREQIENLRQRIIAGEDFSALAVLYSMDKVSARQGGELGFLNRGDLVKEFSAVAFRLKNTTEVSEIVQTEFGYHIIQLIERRGDRINVRHILLTPQTQSIDMENTQIRLDSVAKEIRSGTIEFADAAEKFSTDNDSKLNGGTVLNPANGTSRFESDQVDPLILFQLDKMESGEVSSPSLITTPTGKQAWRILYLKKRYPPHRMNLNDDYQRLQNLTVESLKQQTLESWRSKKIKQTYIKVLPDYQSCDLVQDWTQQ